MTAPAPGDSGRAIRAKLTILVLLTTLLLIGVWLHVPGVNGPFYWKWHWRWLEILPLAGPMLAAAIPFFLGQWVYSAWRRPRLALLLVTLSCLLLEFAAIQAQSPGGIRRATYIIQDTTTSSYFADAQIAWSNHLTMAQWLGRYPELLPRFHLHTQYKPPGPVLFHYAFICAFGPDEDAALPDAFAIAILAALAVPACFWMIRSLGGETHPAFCGASYLSLCPSLLLFYPQMDQIYCMLSSLLVTTWGLALARRSVLFAILFGLLLSIVTFTSYIFLTLGVFLSVFTLLFVADKDKRGFWTALFLGLISVGVFLAFYFILWLTARFDPIGTFDVIQRTQIGGLIGLGRPFPYHVPFDMLDFLLGSGWLSGPLAIFFMIRRFTAGTPRTPMTRLGWLALLQIFTVWMAALLPGESARLWMLFMPLWMIPVGIELSHWPAGFRAVVYVCVLAISISLCRNMIFIYAGLELDGPQRLYLPFEAIRPAASAPTSQPGL